MSSDQNYLFKTFVLVFVAQIVAADGPNHINQTIERHLKSHEVYSNRFSEVEQIMLHSELFTRYKVSAFFKTTKESVNLLATRGDQTYIAKLIKEKDNNFATCKKLEELQKNEMTKVIYASEILEFDHFSGKEIVKENENEKETEKEFFYCILIFKKSKDNLEKSEFIIRQEDLETKLKNSETLYFFFGKVIQFVAELNFKAGVLHGFIRPETILVKENKIENSPGIDIEPEIMDFDLFLENKTGNDLFDPIVRYGYFYRCPEMSKNMKTDESTGKSYYSQGLLSYKYSKNFVEDTFALGTTIVNTLKELKYFLDDKFHGINFLNDLAKQMTSVKEKDKEGYFIVNLFSSKIQVRPDMRQVLDSYLKNVKACTTCKNEDLVKALISSLEKSQKLISGLNIII